MNRPHGWGDQYTIQWCFDAISRLESTITAQGELIANLESEVARLDVQKANRAGRKPKIVENPIAQGDARGEIP